WAWPGRYQARRRCGRVAWARHGLCRDRTRCPIGARRLLRERVSAEASAQSNGVPAVRAVPRAGDLDRLAGGGHAELKSPSGGFHAVPLTPVFEELVARSEH